MPRWPDSGSPVEDVPCWPDSGSPVKDVPCWPDSGGPVVRHACWSAPAAPGKAMPAGQTPAAPGKAMHAGQTPAAPGQRRTPLARPLRLRRRRYPAGQTPAAPGKVNSWRLPDSTRAKNPVRRPFHEHEPRQPQSPAKSGHPNVCRSCTDAICDARRLPPCSRRSTSCSAGSGCEEDLISLLAGSMTDEHQPPRSVSPRPGFFYARANRRQLG